MDDEIRKINENINTTLQVFKNFRTMPVMIIVMSSTIFVVGVSLFIKGWIDNQYWMLAPSLIITGLLHWPIRQLIHIWKYSICFSLAPLLVQHVSAKDAGMIINNMINIFGKKL